MRYIATRVNRRQSIAFALSVWGLATAPTVDAKKKKYTLSGTGDDVSAPVKLAAGRYTVSGVYRGESNFIVWARVEDGYDELLFNEIDSYRGKATFEVDHAGKVSFEVTGSGSWKIKVAATF